MSKQLTMMVGVAMFAALALAGAMGIFAFGTVSGPDDQRRRHQELQRADRWHPAGLWMVTIT